VFFLFPLTNRVTYQPLTMRIENDFWVQRDWGSGCAAGDTGADSAYCDWDSFLLPSDRTDSQRVGESLPRVAYWMAHRSCIRKSTAD